MSQQEYKIPTLVQHIQVDGRPYFSLRPLFWPGPISIHRRYQEAVAGFRKEVRDYLSQIHLNRHTLDQALWLIFNPKPLVRRRKLQFSFGKYSVDAWFLVFQFKVKDFSVVYLPAFNNTMQILSTEGTPISDLELEKIIKKLLQKERDYQGSEFQPDDFYSNQRDDLVEVSVRLDLKFDRNCFDTTEDAHSFFRFFQEMEFDGAEEVAKTGNDLNENYPHALQRSFFRDELAAEIYELMYQRDPIPFVLVGDEGVGRHNLVSNAVYQYLSQRTGNEKELPISVWNIDPNRVISGMSIVGQWQKRTEAIIQHLIKPRVADKLLVDNPVALFRVGKSGQNSMTLSDVFKPYLEKRMLQAILIATPQEWQLIQEKDRAFSDLFQVIRIYPPDPNTALKIILEQRKLLEYENSARISISAISQLMYVHRIFQSNKALPGAVLRLLRQIVIKHRYGYIDAQNVREEFGMVSGLREEIFSAGYWFEKDEVLNGLQRELIGQQEAAQALNNIIQLYKAKLNNPRRPISSLMFIGPTGVGKTHAAKILTRYLTGSEEALVRFDMNEYLDSSSVDRLIGDEYNPEGQLTGKIRYRPFSVLLLDEIEKAHPKIHDLFLQLLDDGRLTDRLGRPVDFTNCIIIMTSNVGADDNRYRIGLGSDPQHQGQAQVYRSALEKQFRPEFVNRIEQLVIFRPLEREHILGIARLQIKELLQRDGFVRRTTILNIQKEALEWVANRGYDPEMGGRALRRQIERDLTSLSADQLLKIRTPGPIILNILLEEDRLSPRIFPLEFASSSGETYLPTPPKPEDGGHFYRRLLKLVEELNDQVRNRDTEPGYYDTRSVQDDWHYYDFITRLDEMKEEIATIMIAFNSNNFVRNLPTPLRLKQSELFRDRSNARNPESLEDIKARLFHDAALKEVSETYQFANGVYDAMDTEFVDHYLNVALLRLAGRAFLRGELDKVEIKIESLVAGQGQTEMDYLADRYQDLLEHLGLEFDYYADEQVIEVENYGIAPLLQSEAGVHLFYLAHQNPLPILVSIKPKADSSNAWQVIRLYDGNRTLTDLRTQFTNVMNMSGQEFKLLVYAGLPKDLRKELMRF
jgi:ATP-dependent Clp protease ATP-binding subunit ClpC